MAYIKKCPECNGKSYSATKRNWICPYCGEDLKEIEAARAKN